MQIKDLKRETLMALTRILDSNMVYPDEILPRFSWIHKVGLHDKGADTIETVKGVKTIKAWRVIHGSDFPYMSQRVGERKATIYITNTGHIGYMFETPYRKETFTKVRAVKDFWGQKKKKTATVTENIEYDTIVLTPQTLVDYFYDEILREINIWLIKLGHFKEDGLNECQKEKIRLDMGATKPLLSRAEIIKEKAEGVDGEMS